MTPSEAIAQLKKSGMTEAAIASKVGAGQPTVNKILRGQMQPNWTLGQKLVVLAKRRRPKPQITPPPTDAGEAA